MKKIKIKFSNPLLVLQLVLVAIIIIVVGSLGIFLRKHFYDTITQAETILVLSKEVAFADIDTNKFKSVLNMNEAKRKSILPEIIYNPFK